MNPPTEIVFDSPIAPQAELPGLVPAPIERVACRAKVTHDLKEDYRERQRLLDRFADKLVVNASLSRQLVSFQANKSAAFYRWFKYKEAFSSEFVRAMLAQFAPSPRSRKPAVLDPFAGVGTTLTSSAALGWEATGVELLPPGIAAIGARDVAARIGPGSLSAAVKRAEAFDFAQLTHAAFAFQHLRITKGAFAQDTETAVAAFAMHIAGEPDEELQMLLRFAAMSVLEDASFTRKDGQYLRWDSRSPRALKSSFDKGTIHSFKDALLSRLHTMLDDVSRRPALPASSGVMKVLQGSCLDLLPTFETASIDLVLTSPPYCNRYDYTRTYALELAYLGCGEDDILRLRQTLLSATVENKPKREQLREAYASREQTAWFSRMEKAFKNQAALHEVLGLLYAAREAKTLNNANIPVMVENYFFEMNVVIHELSRLMRRGAHVVMVNDNVQYHGEEIPVDLILSDFAEAAGLRTEAIWVLDRGKGNSSQQMGVHGRNEIRKCVYVWKKP